MSEQQDPNAVLAEVRAGKPKIEFDPATLCHVLQRVLDEGDYWDDDGYLVCLQLHKEELKAIVDYMGIGVQASVIKDGRLCLDSTKVGLVSTDPVGQFHESVKALTGEFKQDLGE